MKFTEGGSVVMVDKKEGRHEEGTKNDRIDMCTIKRMMEGRPKDRKGHRN